MPDFVPFNTVTTIDTVAKLKPVSKNTDPKATTNINKEDNPMSNTTMTARERRERLELLRDPKARVEEMLRDRRVYKAAFNDYVRYGIAQNSLKKEPGSAGGYLVPDAMESRIVEKLNERNPLRRICTVVQTVQDMEIPIVESHGQAFWVPEGGTLPLSDDRFNRVRISAYKLGTSEIISNELLEDSIIDMEKLITDSFATRIADAEEDAFMNGDGIGKPVGLLTQAEVGVTTEVEGVLTLDDVIDLVYSVGNPYRAKGVLLMNEATRNMLFKIKDAYGRSVWHGDFTHGIPDKLLNYEIVISNAMPDPVSGNKAIAFGDFSEFRIADRGHHHLNRLNELRAKTDQVEFTLTKRVDAKLIHTEAIKTLQIA